VSELEHRHKLQLKLLNLVKRYHMRPLVLS
jgi:hypothetical protein